MKKAFMLLLAAPVVLLVACAPRSAGVLATYDTTKQVKTVYVWDADGHTDLGLLRGLKSEAEARLSSAGYIVSTDPSATGAYVKITVDVALPGSNGFIKARLYIIEAGTQDIIYDKTCEAGSDSEGYPVERFIGCALAEFTGGAGGQG